MASFRITRNYLSGEPTRFVVVDDNAALLQMWRRIFAAERNCSCFLTTSPLEALKEIEIHGANILITDLEMPEMDGITLLHKAKELSTELQGFLTTAHMNRLENVIPWDQTPEVIQKPYTNIYLLQSFIHNLVNHQTPSRDQGRQKGQLFVWCL